jgi:hypothetical protein
LLAAGKPLFFLYVVMDGDGKRVYELTRQNNFEPNQLTHEEVPEVTRHFEENTT